MLVSKYCGWQSRAGVTRYIKFRKPYTTEPAAFRNTVKTGYQMINNARGKIQ